MGIKRRAQNPKLSTTSKLVFYPVVMTSETISHGGRKGKKKVVRLYRVGRIRQAVEFLLHVLQDFCGRAVLWFAVVDLIQDCIENLHSKKKKKSKNNHQRENS